jgi:hypothetical protein
MMSVSPLRFALAFAGVCAIAPLALSQTPLVQHAYLKAESNDKWDQFGTSIALSGDFLAVGAPLESSDGTSPSNNSEAESGAVYIYRRLGISWVPAGTIKAPLPIAGDHFGASLDLDGNTLAVGATGDDTKGAEAGAVHVYVFNGLNWQHQAKLTGAFTEFQDGFGFDVDLEGDRLLIGAPTEDGGSLGVNGNEASNGKNNSGAAYLFERFATTWTQTTYFKALNADPGDQFGTAVSLDGNQVLIGAPFEGGKVPGVNANPANNGAIAAGAAYTFTNTTGAWVQEAHIKPVNPQNFAQFGISVDIEYDRLVIGANQENSRAKGVNGNPFDMSAGLSGAAYMFERQPLTGWSQSAYIKATNTDANDLFGRKVALHGNTLLISAIYEASSARGIDGDDSLNNANKAGAVYMLEYMGGAWQHTHYIKASNAGSAARFGVSLAMQDATIIVGANQENSPSTGVNGAQEFGGLLNSGAVYVIDTPPATCGSTTYGLPIGANVAKLDSSVIGTPLQKTQVRGLDFPSNGVALLALSTKPAGMPFAGGTLLIDPAYQVPSMGSLIPVAVTGKRFELNLMPPAGAVGTKFYMQAAMIDPTQPSGIALTTGLSLTVCP